MDADDPFSNTVSSYFFDHSVHEIHPKTNSPEQCLKALEDAKKMKAGCSTNAG